MDREFDAQLKKHCPEVKRVAGSALLDAFDFLHIFGAADAREAAKAALVANAFGLASTQTLPAIPSSEFRNLLEEL